MEIDGGYHATEEQKIKDDQRSGEIMSVRPGVEVVRFTNDQVMNEPDCLFRALIGRIEKKFEAMQGASSGQAGNP